LPLTLPNLDDLRWEDLVEEGRSLIPAYAPKWTNHNPSDPGMTLIELFAYESERLMYQTNRITRKQVLRFLKLIKGREVHCTSEEELLEEKRAAVRALRESKRAVTSEDFEELARNVAGMSAGDQKGRAICIPGRNLESEDPAAQVAKAPGHVSVIVIPRGDRYPSRELLVRVKQALEPSRLLTTRVHVVGPRYLKLGIRVSLVLQRGASADPVLSAVIQRVKEFFDPLTGWIDQKGWPLGRSVHVSELYQLLGDIEGIEVARPSRDPGGAVLDEFVLDPPQPKRIKRNARGEMEAIELRPHELSSVTITRADITVAQQT